MHGVRSELGKWSAIPDARLMEFKQRGCIGPIPLLSAPES